MHIKSLSVTIPLSITLAAATGTKGPPPGCTLNTEGDYGLGYERIGSTSKPEQVPCRPIPGSNNSHNNTIYHAPRARIHNGKLSVIKSLYKPEPSNDMEGIDDATPNPPTAMAFTRDGRLVEVERATAYSTSPIDADGLFAYCEPDGYVAFRGLTEFWGCTREPARGEERERLFMSTYERVIGACRPYRMRMLPCVEGTVWEKESWEVPDDTESEDEDEGLGLWDRLRASFDAFVQ